MNMLASVLSPGFGVFTGVLLSPAVVVVVFSLVIRGTGAIPSPVRSVRAVRLTLILLILTAVLGGVCSRVVCGCASLASRSASAVASLCERPFDL